MAAVAVLGLATAIPAVAGKSAHRVADNPIGLFNADFSPSALSKKKPTPIRFTATTRIKAGTAHPPPLKELRLKLDRQVSLDLKEIPTTADVEGCLPRSVRIPSVGKVRKDCGPAVVGYGRMDVEVQFPDQNPVQVASQIVALNGGIEGGTAKLYLYSSFSAPVTGAIVTTMQIEKIRKGRYGLEAIATIPKIAGGSGSITSFALTFKRGVLSATCPDGRLNFHGKPVFAESAGPGESIVRTCVAKPEARR
ncbi:MAG TPA: hypothetical protein VLI94_10915 [Solirubrobacterales bacterium]|nr:hypothetical protein [Solirubrobacterales bacterium]